MVVSLFYPFKFSLLFFVVRGYVPTSTATPWSARPSLDEHVEKERTRTDTKSLPFLRETQLYSRSSQGHLRIMRRDVDALGKDGDKFAKLIIESDNFGRVKIRGAESSYYLCVRKKDGRLVGRKVAKASKSKCVFYEKYATNFFSEFYSAFKPSWMITVSKKGTVRPSFKGKTGSKSVQFIERPSKLIIKTSNVGPSFMDGLSKHIAKLLRNVRARVRANERSQKKKRRRNRKDKRRPGRKNKRRSKKRRKKKQLRRKKKRD
ncbi:fibroblast growth factor 18 [Exaiptasia diaphana]|uniref:Fibroblast growth factor 8 n=1 Tax=Exaiptasia diaphana TaxID=2652724 RepID=A0A913Y2W3_EXADI|nr:fibroblast growth factor 18 [Exaiptasia diaphana]KXJ23098.1 Fibroblast growth factor 17 [Exaiptasia diaphana]